MGRWCGAVPVQSYHHEGWVMRRWRCYGSRLECRLGLRLNIFLDSLGLNIFLDSLGLYIFLGSLGLYIFLGSLGFVLRITCHLVYYYHFVRVVLERFERRDFPNNLDF